MGGRGSFAKKPPEEISQATLLEYISLAEYAHAYHTGATASSTQQGDDIPFNLHTGEVPNMGREREGSPEMREARCVKHEKRGER